MIDPSLPASKQASLYRACARKYDAAAKAERKAAAAVRRATAALRMAEEAVNRISDLSYDTTTYPDYRE
jgi:hypothetical protein